MDQAEVTKDGQITLPPSIREKLGIEPGGNVEFYENDNGEVVIRREQKIARARGIVEEGPITIYKKDS